MTPITDPAATKLMQSTNAWAMKPTPPKLKLLALVIAQALALQVAQAATIEVTSNLDNGTDCTLREAITTVNTGANLSNGCVIDTGTDALGTNDTIIFGPAVAGSTITTNGQLAITKSVSLNPSGDQTTIDANDGSRVMSIRYVSGVGPTVSLDQLTITGGNTVVPGALADGINGSGIEVSNANLYLSNSTVSDNTALGNGGGILAFSSNVTVSNSTVSDNIARYGGGIYAEVSSSVSLSNSTISGNTAIGNGGGISADNTTVSLSNSTVASNGVRLPASIFLNFISGGISAIRSSVSLSNSIVAGNSNTQFPFISTSSADCRAPDPFNPVINVGADTISTRECGGARIADPLLGPLQDNGGPTQTHALLSGSPAIDNGTAVGASPTDQRGFAAVGIRDSGAYEFGAVEPAAFNPVSLINNRWAMVGLSQVLPSMTVQAVFATTAPTGLLPSDYNRLWVVYRRDESTDSYVQMALGDTLEQGRGYWILHITGTDLEFAPSGGVTAVDDTNPNCPSADGCFEIDLAEGDGRYNLISHPFTTDVSWNDIRIEVNGVQVCSPAQAAGNGLVDDLFSNYNGSSYDMFSSTIPIPGGGVFEPFRGYWVQTLSGSVGTDVKLLIPNGPASDSPACEVPVPVALIETRTNESRPQNVSETCLPWWLSWISEAQAAEDTTLKRGEWWVRLQAQSSEDGGMLDQYNYLGWYRDSEDGEDRRDLKELSPFGTPYLTIVFRHDDWVEDAGDYSTDFRKRKFWREDEQWDFIVKSDKVGREVTLSWEGYNEHSRFYRMRLVDVENDKTVRTNKRRDLLSYTFTTQRKEHRFKWVYMAWPK